MLSNKQKQQQQQTNTMGNLPFGPATPDSWTCKNVRRIKGDDGWHDLHENWSNGIYLGRYCFRHRVPLNGATLHDATLSHAFVVYKQGNMLLLCEFGAFDKSTKCPSDGLWGVAPGCVVVTQWKIEGSNRYTLIEHNNRGVVWAWPSSCKRGITDLASLYRLVLFCFLCFVHFYFI